MKQSEAKLHLNRLLLSVQKYRSNARIELGSLEGSDEVLLKTQPYIFRDDEGGLMAITLKALDLAEQGRLQPISFFNIMTIVHLLEPAVLMGFVVTEWPLPPEPDPLWVARGWDAEAAEEAVHG